jgi:hypothetical protein
MVYLSSVKGCTRPDCFHSEDIRQELNVTPIIANTDSYRKGWGDHLQRLDGSQIPKIAFKYIPKGERDVGCPRKRWSLQSQNKPFCYIIDVYIIPYVSLSV